MLNLLDGLRDLKAPLASGLITLFGLWLIFSNQLSEVRPGQSLAGNVHALLDFVGIAGSLGLATFTAYLLGIIIPFHRIGYLAYRALGGNEMSLGRHPIHREVLLFAYRILMDAQLQDIPIEKLMKQVRMSFVEVRNPSPLSKGRTGSGQRLGLLPKDTKIDFEKPTDRDVANAIVVGVQTEFDMLPSQLQAAKDPSYDLYDKNRSEADFRASMVIPIWFVTTVVIYRLSTEGQPWFTFFGFVAVAVAGRLMTSATERLRQANLVILEAVVQKRVRIGAIEQIQAGVDENKAKSERNANASDQKSVTKSARTGRVTRFGRFPSSRGK